MPALRMLVLHVRDVFPHKDLNEAVVKATQTCQHLAVLDCRLCNLSTGDRVPIRRIPPMLEVLRLFTDVSFTDEAFNGHKNLKALDMCMAGDAITTAQVQPDTSTFKAYDASKCCYVYLKASIVF